ncbi:MAG TPA: serine hydrolase domain-containing protein [Terriglobales bacterium]
MDSLKVFPGKYSLALLFVVLLAAVAVATAQTSPPLPADSRSGIDEIATNALTATGVPSASIAVVKGGKIVYLQAYGDARLDPKLAATPEMQYSVGSISKQFTAAAILLLQEQGKLSLDDPVSKYVPGLTRGNEVTIRQLLSHTSGYQDYWPQDYVMQPMLQPTSAQQILDRWAKIPLDFDPGTKWQYSNTNYVIAGLIVEKVAGMPMLQLLHQRVFGPLGMKSIANVDEAKLPDTDPEGYFRYAIGPLRPAPKEGKGWIFAAGELAMTAEDLAKWNVSLMNQSILKPASYHAMETEVVLNNGVGTRYGLGLSVFGTNGRRVLEHDGEVSGFTAENIVLPDDGFAVSVLTNQDAAGAASQIGRGILNWFLKSENVQDPKQDALVRKVFDGLKQGTIDRSLFTENANAYFTAQALKDYANSLTPLGDPQSFAQSSVSLRGGMTHRSYQVKYPQKTLGLNIYEMPDGKFEQFLIAVQE